VETTRGLQREDKFRIIAALLAVYVFWGSTYFAMRVALDSLPPFLMAGARFVIAGVMLFAWLRFRGAPNPTWAEWRAGLLVGVLLLVVGNGAVAMSEQWVASGLAAVMVAMVPLWAGLFGGFWGEWPRLREWIGLGLGAVGVLLMNLDGDLRASALGAGLLLIAPVSWALGSVWSRRLPLAKGAMASATQMLCAGVLMVLLSLAFEPTPTVVTPRAFAAVGYLIVFGSLIAFSAYGYLLRAVRPAVATSYAYVNPVVALALGMAVGGETVTPLGFAGAAVVLVGVVLALLSRSQARPPVHKAEAPKAPPLSPEPGLARR
jgi:drug/metabolite transporter (DMT)-like permease